MARSGSRYLPHLLLGAMILIWGGSYAVVKAALDTLLPFTVIAVRFWIATLCLLPFALREGRAAFATTRTPGCAAGVALAIGYCTQTVGMQYTSSSVAGFIAGLIVPLVAIGGCLFFGARFGARSVLGLLLAVAGMTLLCWPTDGSGDSTMLGIVLQLLSTVSYVAHILLLSKFGSRMPAAAYSTWQMLVVALIGTACWLVVDASGDHPPAVWTIGNLLLIGYLAVLASALGVGVQSRVQHRIPSMHLALLFALQPLFAAFFGWLTLARTIHQGDG